MIHLLTKNGQKSPQKQNAMLSYFVGKHYITGSKFIVFWGTKSSGSRETVVLPIYVTLELAGEHL
jgi:hypothetical protein